MTTLPNVLPEDTVSYRLYPGAKAVDLNEILAFAHSLPVVSKYLFHCDGFNLASRGGFFEGQSTFGASQNDEVLLIWMLFEITKKFELTATLEDTEGDILLAVSSFHLEEWIDPETSENRVFIRRGKLFIVNDHPDEPVKTPEAGLKALKESHLASDEIQNSIQEYLARVDLFTENPGPNHHRAALCVPLKVARVLETYPSIVAPAVNAFYTRDMLSMRAVKKMDKFSVLDAVPVQVRFTQVMYAQIASQDFTAPRKFREQGFTRPKHDKTKDSYEIGMKLSAGLEMLYQDCKRRKSNSGSATEHPKWQQYLRKLTEIGHFQGLMEGSKAYTARMKAAETAFREAYAKHGPEGEEERFSWSTAIDKVLASEDEARAKELRAQKLEDLRNDSSDFMNIDENELNEMLRPYLPPTGIPEGGDPEELQKAFASLSKVQNGVQGFLEGVSDFDGAGRQSGNPTDFKDDDPHTGISSKSSGLDADMEQLLQMMDSALGSELKGGDDLKAEEFMENLLASFTNENGQPGPVTTMLSQLARQDE